MPPSALASRPRDIPMEVLSLGLPRTGTASMRAALLILGYDHTYHALDVIENRSDFAIWEKAADATFYGKRPKLTRDEWDEMLGHCRATTDFPSNFAEEMVEIYPEAKVVLVERDVEKWYKSFENSILKSMFGFKADFVAYVIEPMIGSRGSIASRKVLFGFFRANTVDEIRQNARQRYIEHYETVRRIVPEDKLLNFKLTDGWDPLCAFLGKEVPEEEFPWVNEEKAFQETVRRVQNEMVGNAIRKLAPVVLAGAVIGIAYVLRRR